MHNLEKNDVHIWSIRLDQAGCIVPSMLEILTEVDLVRAATFRYEFHHWRYLVTRGFLRSVLADYTGHSPGSLQFQSNYYGKPFLLGHQELQFNLAHSGSIAILAVSRDFAVGADVERLRFDIETDALVKNYFSEEEIGSYLLVPDKYKIRAFFDVWTCKEAIVKATGYGLSYPLNKFTVDMGQGSVSRLSDCTNLPFLVSEWKVKQTSPAPGYIGAIAVQVTDNEKRFREFEYKFD